MPSSIPKHPGSCLLSNAYQHWLMPILYFELSQPFQILHPVYFCASATSVADPSTIVYDVEANRLDPTWPPPLFWLDNIFKGVVWPFGEGGGGTREYADSIFDLLTEVSTNCFFSSFNRTRDEHITIDAAKRFLVRLWLIKATSETSEKDISRDFPDRKVADLTTPRLDP